MRIKTCCLLVLASSVVLTSCSEKKALKGKRENIIVSESDLQVSGLKRDVEFDFAQSLTQWTQYGANKNNAPGVLNFPENPKKIWRYNFHLSAINGNCMTSSPLLVGENILFVDGGGILRSINAKTHEKNWEFSSTIKGETGQTGTALAYSNGVIILSTSFSECMGLSERGKLLWRISLPAPCKGDAITVDGNVAYLACSNNSLQKLDIKTGKIIWSSKAVDSVNSLIGNAAPVVYGDYVVVPYSSGEVSCVRASDGVEVWESIVSKFSVTDVASTLQHLRASPVLDNGIAYIVSSTGVAEAFEISTGGKLWSKNIGGVTPVASSKTHIFVIGNNAELVCLDKNDGTIAWTTKLTEKEKIPFWNWRNIYKGFGREIETYQSWHSSFVTDKGLVIISASGKILYIDPKNGNVRKCVEIGHPLSVPPIVVDGVMYVLCDDGCLIAYK